MQINHILLQWDLNYSAGFAETKRPGLNTVMSEVANIFKTHDGKTYLEWVQTVKFPGNKYDEELRKKQDAQINCFLDDLKALNHPDYPKALSVYNQLAEMFIDANGAVNFTLFPALVNLIKAVERTCPFSVILRTFGQDGASYAKQFDFPFKKCDFVQEGLKDSGQVKTGPELFKALLKEHILGQDNVAPWLENGRKEKFGKQIYCSADGEFEGKKVVVIFGDDNFMKKTAADPDAQNIAHPVDVFGREVGWKSAGIMGLRIEPVKSGLEPNYLIDKVNKRLCKRGFAPLK